MNFSSRNGSYIKSGTTFPLISRKCCCPSVLTICFKQNKISLAIKLYTSVIRGEVGKPLIFKLFNISHEKEQESFVIRS